MIPAFRYARTSRMTPASSMRLLSLSIRMSWLTRSKNLAKSTSTTTRLPDWTYVCAALTASTPTGTKPVAVFAEGGVYQRLQHL